MSAFKVIAVKQNPIGFQIMHIDFKADTTEFKFALFAHIEKNAEKYGDCYFLDAEFFSPITFDCTMQLMGGLDKPYPNDRFETTFNKFNAMVKECEKQKNFVSVGSFFCRTLFSDSGKAGKFFTDFDKDFGTNRKDRSAPFDKGILNNPESYWENRPHKKYF